MQCFAVLGFLFVMCLPITAEPVGSLPEESKAQNLDAAAAVNFNFGKPVREGALLQLADYVKHGDTLLKDRMQASYSSLREELKQGDSLVKDQLKDGDSRMKEELDEDVAWLKDKLSKGQRRMKQYLGEVENQFSSQMNDLKEAFAKLQDSVKSSGALTDDLKQQMIDVQAELETSKQKVETTEQELLTTRQELQAKLETAQAEVDSLKAEVEGLQSSHRPAVPGAFHAGDEDHAVSVTGSVFTRWGRKTCPDNTTLVYSGIAGGSWWGFSGGASNYLCLVRNPQLDKETAVPVYYNGLYGAEYELVKGRQQQDVVCSVCRAPQATTITVPATLTCPAGWTTQYKGHLMSERNVHKGRTEYVCVDMVKEYGDGGLENKDGALFYHVVTLCGSLPCPPYVNTVIATCVVCSQ